MHRTTLLWLAACALATPHAALAASFDCSRAGARIEKLICADPELSQLDEHLARNYTVARQTLGRGASCLQKDQRTWLQTRNECADASCVKSAYLRRLGELDRLQPGATALQNVSLPAATQLVWIVPPAEDELAAPRSDAAEPLEANGRLVDDTSTGDGFVLETASGGKFTLMMLMFIDPQSADVFQSLLREKDARFLARGYALSDDERAFNPAHCVFVYRLP